MSDELNEAVDRGDEFDPFAETVAEETTEAAPEAEVEEVEAAAEEPERDDKGHLIPKDRFDEAVRKERSEKEQLAARLKAYEERDAQRAQAADLDGAMQQVRELVKQHTNLLADGELDKASEVMENIINLQADMAAYRAESVANNAKDRAKQEVQYDAVVSRLETDYPVINPDSDAFDEQVVRKVQAYMTGLIQNERMAPSRALEEAVTTLLPKSDPTPPLADVNETGMRRKEAAVQKNLDARAKQPASTKDVGLDHDKEGGSLDASAVAKMSWEEFVKLPEDKLANMRGDFVN